MIEDAEGDRGQGSGDRLLSGRVEGGEGDEVDAGIAFDGDERVPFNLAGFEETGVGLRESLVAIAGVRDKFECALGHGRDEGVYDGEFEGARGENSDRAVCGDKALLSNDTAETGLKAAEKEDFGAAGLGSIGCCIDAPKRLERIANGANAGGPGGT